MRLEERIMQLADRHLYQLGATLTDLALKVGLLEDALERIMDMPPFHSPYNSFTDEEIADEPCEIARRVLIKVRGTKGEQDAGLPS